MLDGDPGWHRVLLPPSGLWYPKDINQDAIATFSQHWLHAKRGPSWSLAVPCGHLLEEVETLSQLRFLSKHLTFCLTVTRT